MIASFPPTLSTKWEASLGRLLSCSGTLSVVKQDGPDAYHLIETVSTRINARTGTVDPKTGTVFLVAPESTVPAPPAAGGKAPPPVYISDTFSIIVIERAQLN